MNFETIQRETDRLDKNRRIRERIEAAGISYPISWEEMSGSAKDRWEDSQLNYIAKRNAREVARIDDLLSHEQPQERIDALLRDRAALTSN